MLFTGLKTQKMFLPPKRPNRLRLFELEGAVETI